MSAEHNDNNETQQEQHEWGEMDEKPLLEDEPSENLSHMSNATLARWIHMMKKMDQRARRGEWTSCRLFSANELGDMLHMFYRSGLKLVDIECCSLGVWCELSWRRATKGYARRMRNAARRCHFGKLAGPSGVPDMPD
jgi:hypothetical protein